MEGSAQNSSGEWKNSLIGEDQKVNRRRKLYNNSRIKMSKTLLIKLAVKMNTKIPLWVQDFV